MASSLAIAGIDAGYGAVRVLHDVTLRVRRGERVELRFSTDRPIQLHLHGYDIEAGASPESIS